MDMKIILGSPSKFCRGNRSPQPKPDWTVGKKVSMWLTDGEIERPRIISPSKKTRAQTYVACEVWVLISVTLHSPSHSSQIATDMESNTTFSASPAPVPAKVRSAIDTESWSLTIFSPRSTDYVCIKRVGNCVDRCDRRGAIYTTREKSSRDSRRKSR